MIGSNVAAFCQLCFNILTTLGENMKKVWFFALLLTIGLSTRASEKLDLMHFDLEMTGQEYRSLFKMKWPFGHHVNSQLSPVMDMGTRNLDWITLINSHRDSLHQLSFTGPLTRRSYPLETPTTYNPAIILSQFQKTLSLMPENMKTILSGHGPLPTSLPIPDSIFVLFGGLIDDSYQVASRWNLMEPRLPFLALIKRHDLRGFYFLSHDPQVRFELENFAKLAPTTRALFQDYLVQMCENNTEDPCAKTVSDAILKNQAFQFYQSKLQGSQNLWDSYFKIAAKRKDVTWKESPEELHVPFKDPSNTRIKTFLSSNIQDEWHWKDWHLFLDFQQGSHGTPEIVFETGASPHVNAVGGSTITMDENAPLSEFLVQWAIRHEFGHVLGFPDCYIEFYDRDRGVMMSYQLDTSNIMCSRKGRFQEWHYQELKRVYGKN